VIPMGLGALDLRGDSEAQLKALQIVHASPGPMVSCTTPKSCDASSELCQQPASAVRRAPAGSYRP
jgi:hypothetical protein